MKKHLRLPSWVRSTKTISVADNGLERQQVDKGTQILLSLKYREMARNFSPLPRLQDVEFHHYSQNGEDGVLLFLFAILGTTNRRCVELCAGDGIECNTANLIVNHGWKALMFDGSQENIQKGQAFYANRPGSLRYHPPTMVQSWITIDNINSLIAERGFDGEIDLFSLDIDGNDYWIWKAIDVIRPRVVVLEFNSFYGIRRAVSIPHQPDFVFDWSTPCCGASLPAFVKLGKQKGYRLVGTESNDVNAFFVRDGIGEELLPEISLSSVEIHGDADPDLSRWPLVEV